MWPEPPRRSSPCSLNAGKGLWVPAGIRSPAERRGCDPRSLLRDLQEGLGANHEIVRMAVFDHFPYTRHIECGVYLREKGLVGQDIAGPQTT